jgi:epoxyqueuosine reductase
MREELEQRARAAGFAAVGIAPAQPAAHSGYLLQWLAEGRHGDMEWMQRDPQRRADPRKVLPEARSIIVLGMNYFQPEPPRRGRISKYALGKDYHKVMIQRLKQLCKWLSAHGAINKPYVDTGPLLEKPLAAAAGLGWQGKNTILLHPRHGQWLFLGCILTSYPFNADAPVADRCGSCTRCIDVCPTKAITGPYQLDARLCISYLTIEHKGPIPDHLRSLIGDHLYGCDDCLDVCPWNKWAKHCSEPAFAPRPYPDLRDQLDLSDEAFRELYAGSPIRRLGRSRWLRNVAVVLGNTGTPEDLAALQRLRDDPDPLISGHVRWAMQRIQQRHS